MHNAWQKHLEARESVVANRVFAYDGGDTSYDGSAGVTPLQLAEDALYGSNVKQYETTVEIFNEKYPTLQGKYTEEAPSKNALGDQVEKLREQITQMQTDNANFRCVISLFDFINFLCIPRADVLARLDALVESDSDSSDDSSGNQPKYKKRKMEEVNNSES
jgi:hypothetical protein